MERKIILLVEDNPDDEALTRRALAQHRIRQRLGDLHAAVPPDAQSPHAQRQVSGVVEAKHSEEHRQRPTTEPEHREADE